MRIKVTNLRNATVCKDLTIVNGAEWRNDRETPHTTQLGSYEGESSLSCRLPAAESSRTNSFTLGRRGSFHRLHWSLYSGWLRVQRWKTDLRPTLAVRVFTIPNFLEPHPRDVKPTRKAPQTNRSPVQRTIHYETVFRTLPP